MRGISVYQSVSKQSASPERLLLMLYKRIIQVLHQAIDDIEAGEAGEATEALRIGREILVELTAALDHSVSPELTGNLHRLYAWCIRELVAASRQRDVEKIRGVLEVIEPLHGAWQAVLEG